MCSDDNHCDVNKPDTDSERYFTSHNEFTRITCSHCETKQPLEEIVGLCPEDNNATSSKTVDEAFYNEYPKIRLLE